jgi:hypothetical protein
MNIHKFYEPGESEEDDWFILHHPLNPDLVEFVRNEGWNPSSLKVVEAIESSKDYDRVKSFESKKISRF